MLSNRQLDGSFGNYHVPTLILYKVTVPSSDKCFLTVSGEKIGRPCQYHVVQTDEEELPVQPLYLSAI